MVALKTLVFISVALKIQINNVFKREKGMAADISCLMLWHELEINNPNLFGGMYQFWTQKFLG